MIKVKVSKLTPLTLPPRKKDRYSILNVCLHLYFTAKKFGVTEVTTEAVTFISHATQSRLRSVVEKVSAIAQHRLDSCKVGRAHAYAYPQKHIHCYDKLLSWQSKCLVRCFPQC